MPRSVSPWACMPLAMPCRVLTWMSTWQCSSVWWWYLHIASLCFQSWNSVKLKLRPIERKSLRHKKLKLKGSPWGGGGERWIPSKTSKISHQQKKRNIIFISALVGDMLVPRRVYKSGWQVNRFWCNRRKLTACLFVAMWFLLPGCTVKFCISLHIQDCFFGEQEFKGISNHEQL